ISKGSDLLRLQCAFIDTSEIEAISEHIGNQQAFLSPSFLPEFVPDSEEAALDFDLQKRDPLFAEAAHLIVAHQQGSTSLIQRKFSIGYNRAGKIIDQLEAARVVGPFQGSKARQVLFTDEMSLEQFLSKLDKN
ncbi:MAG: DNA translocase FtsK, partial [Bacteroidia bacterium]|nr:DNA translocase FtsK [Bacteroidia bacterium]